MLHEVIIDVVESKEHGGGVDAEGLGLQEGVQLGTDEVDVDQSEDVSVRQTEEHRGPEGNFDVDRNQSLGFAS